MTQLTENERADIRAALSEAHEQGRYEVTLDHEFVGALLRDARGLAQIENRIEALRDSLAWKRTHSHHCVYKGAFKAVCDQTGIDTSEI